MLRLDDAKQAAANREREAARDGAGSLVAWDNSRRSGLATNNAAGLNPDGYVRIALAACSQASRPYAHQIVEFVHDHEAWAAPVVFALAFGESLAFISLLIPAWAALVGIGVLIASGDLELLADLGGGLARRGVRRLAVLLDRRQARSAGGAHLAAVAPSRSDPDGRALREDVGACSAIFIGRFFGPLRASVPLVAGIFAMPYLELPVRELHLGVSVGRPCC